MGIALPGAGGAIRESMASGAQFIDGSLKFDETKTQHLNRTPSSAGNRKTWTWSGWVKRSTLGTGSGGRSVLFDSTVGWTGSGDTTYGLLNFSPTNQFGFGVASTGTYTTAIFRDTSAWYHVVAAMDTTQAAAAGRLKLYVNGVQYTHSGYTFTQNTDYAINTATEHAIGMEERTDAAKFDGFMSQSTFIDGLSLGPSYFGFTDPLTGTWRPKKFKAEGTTVNDGTVWSDSISGTEDSGWSKTQSFSGVLSNSSRASSGNSLTWTPSTPIPIKHSLRIYGRKRGNGNAVLTVNGTNYASLLTEGSETYITVPESHITTVVWSNVNGNSDSVDIGGFEVDGVIMKDSTTTNLAFGTNGFYLPMDGNLPIGQDQSGKGNNWTPDNFGGLELGNPNVSGARPILNTTAGVVARPGVFGSEVGFRDTVSGSSGGGNPYIFDTNGTQPTFNFIRGATYVFDYSSATSHPLRFATAANAAGSTEYTDGTSVSGNVISFTVPHNAPNTLYYYCTNHNGMGNSISVTTDETKADPYAWKCVLALPLVGSDDDVSNSVNSGSTTKVTASTNAAASSAASNFYGGSWIFDGSGDYVAVTDNADLAFGTGDSTVELWVYPNTLVSNDVLYDSRQSTGSATTGFSIVVNSSGTVSTYTASGYRCQSTTKLQVGKWSHIAVVRSSGTDTLFIDGIAQADTDTNNGNYTDQKCRIGSDVNGDESWGGHISDFRLYKGVAKYTSNFVPASTNPDILPDTPSGVSGGSKLTKITDGAVAFDGASDNLSVPDHADLDFGTGAFTIECFLYMNSYGSSGSYPSFISKYTNSLSWIMRAKNDGKLIWYSSTGGGTNNESTTNPMTLKKWLHIAAVREGTGSNQMKVYVDGKLNLTVTDANDYNDSNDLCIGSQNTGNTNVIDGFVSNVRIVKGTAVYTSDFTPPFRTLTSVTNTKLLCCQSPTSATTAAVIPTGSITANGNATATTFNPFNTDINTVRGQETGYPTFNPFYKISGTANTYSDGNLVLTAGDNNSVSLVNMSMPTSGKWYAEIIDINSSSGAFIGGVGDPNQIFSDFLGRTATGWGYQTHASNAGYWNNNSFSTTGQINGHGSNLILNVAVDRDNGYLWFGINGVYVNGGNPSAGTGYLYSNIPLTGDLNFGGSSGTGKKVGINCGQKPFKFTPPNGFQSLNAASARPETVIARPEQYVGPMIYSGATNSGDTNITSDDIQFIPDLVWTKVRTGGNESPFIYDSVRGDGSGNKRLRVDSNLAQTTYVGSNDLAGFVKGGFTMNGNNGHIYNNGYTHVAWMWKAGGRKNTFTVDDVGYASAADAGFATGGSNITPTAASVGTKQGFSIVTWDVGSLNGTLSLDTGLTQAPEFVITKILDADDDWLTFHKELSSTESLLLNTYRHKASNAAYAHTFNSDGTISGLVVPNWWTANKSYIFYSWHSVPGLQKFGSYVATQADDGPSVELGFKPAIIMVKGAGPNASTALTAWTIFDNKRPFAYNPTHSPLYNKNHQEGKRANGDSTGSNLKIDFLSNGFKIRATGAEHNTNTGADTYVYAAWAEAPAFNLYGAQSNAR